MIQGRPRTPSNEMQFGLHYPANLNTTPNWHQDASVVPPSQPNSSWSSPCLMQQELSPFSNDAYMSQSYSQGVGLGIDYSSFEGSHPDYLPAEEDASSIYPVSSYRLPSLSCSRFIRCILTDHPVAVRTRAARQLSHDTSLVEQRWGEAYQERTVDYTVGLAPSPQRWHAQLQGQQAAEDQETQGQQDEQLEDPQARRAAQSVDKGHEQHTSA